MSDNFWIPARPPGRPEFLCWDVTAPADSVDFAQRMQRRLRWRNLLAGAPMVLRYVESPSGIPLFMPCGPHGTNNNDDLFRNQAPRFQRTIFNPQHGTGRNPGILYLSSHGIPGFLFSEHEHGVLIGTTQIIGSPGNPGGGAPAAAYQWNSRELKYVIFAACRQLAGRPQQALWARAMRGSQPLHGILTYCNTSPVAGSCTSINRRFVQALASGSTLLDAWRNAHPGRLRNRWASLIHEGARNDSVTQWTRDGSLNSSPSPSGPILYFDEDVMQRNPRGQTVNEPERYLDLSFSLGPNQPSLPPWSLLRMAGQLILNFKLTSASRVQFDPGDRIWISAAQVRPDYYAPFDIQQLFRIILPSGQTMAQHGINVLAKIHDRSVFQASDYDTYEFVLPTTPAQAQRMRYWLQLNSSDPRHLRIAIELGNAQFLRTQQLRHGHPSLPIFYLMGRIEKNSGQSFGIPATGPSRTVSQRALVQDFQFAVFLLSSFRRNP